MSWKWKVPKFFFGAGAAWMGGNKLGEYAFGEEPNHEGIPYADRTNQFLVRRGKRYENEKMIHDWSFDRPEHKIQLSTEEWRRFPLEIKKQNTADSAVLRFQLPSLHGSSGCALSSYVLLRFKDTDGKWVVRPYTPVSCDWEFGYFDLLVKKYPNGKMGNHLHSLLVGDRVEVKGPYTKLEIDSNTYANIGLIGGGSGITPLWQVMFGLAKDKQSKTNCSLLYSNHSPQEVLFKQRLANLNQSFKRMDVYNTVTTRGGEEWDGGIGRINKEMIKAKMPSPGTGKILVCGPPSLVEAVAGAKTNNGRDQGPLGGMLKELGYSEEEVFKY